MSQSLLHRGPDGEGLFHLAHIGLAHRRLAVLDLSTSANQPFFSNDGRYAMIYNGEVYNYQLIAQKMNYIPETQSDTEVILEHFARYGIHAIEEWNGMFALAIYDLKEQELILIRDRIGIKPLVYYLKDNDLAFASELKALMSLNIDRCLSFQALQDYLFFEYIPGKQSVFKDIFRLEPGSYLKINPHKISLEFYYKINNIFLKSFSRSSENDTFQEFNQHFKKSVQNQLIADVPVGAFLSGGVDSSFIIANVNLLNHQPFYTFTIGFDEPKYDETHFAKIIGNHFGYTPVISNLGARSIMSLIESLPNVLDEPYASPSFIPTYYLSKVAKTKVTVALSGDGGDELFMGYGYYKWYDRFSRIYSNYGKLGLKIISKLLGLMGKSKTKAARILDIPDIDWAWLHIWSQEQNMFNKSEIEWLIGKNYDITQSHIYNDWKAIDALKIHPYEKISLFDMLFYLPYNLLHKIDMASMAFGLEVRVPYLDHTLAEAVLGYPINLKIKDNNTKYLLKKSLLQYLNPELVFRKKWGFPAPIHKWLSEDLSFLIPEYLDASKIKASGVFNPRFVEQLVNDFKKGKTDNAKKIWALIIFEYWKKANRL